MKNKEYLKKYLWQSLIIILIFMFLFLVLNNIEYNKYKQNFNYKINAILNKIKIKYPDVSELEIMEIINSDGNNYNALKEYGYDLKNDSYIIDNDKDNLFFNVLTLIASLTSFMILMYLFLRYELKNNQEIDKIIKCIEDINHKNYELKIEEISEDKLSILKQEIYKTTIMLKENAENSLKDKINLKNSLQDISHQLKTPLTSINILLDNIIDDPKMNSRTRQNFVKQIKREIANITFLVQSILKLSKFESNTIDFNRENVVVKKLINETVKNVSNLCDLKNVNIEIKGERNNKINCDYYWQIEALTNIVKNAVEYSKSGDKVLIECEDNNVYSQIKIKDFGKGMDEVDVSNIFKSFYKGKNALKESIGIGLSLAKTIIEKDNGSVSVSSEIGVGTTFIIKYFK